MELTFKMTEEMLEEAFRNALNNIEIQTTGMTLNECVEKQIPMKPNGIHCHSCNYTLIRNYDLYCPRCGQRVDWSNA